MKTVGKQLQEARLAKNWTPELAARETKIKVDRLRELESDDYSHFTSPTYARGFVRTYARSLGLDEYKILRQLDNKLPDDDSANIVTDTGVAYLPETAMPPRAAHRDYTGLYIVMALGGVVTLAIVFVLFEAYRVGELSIFFGSNTATVASESTNAPAITPSATVEPVARALPVDSNTPPPIVDATPPPPPTNATAEAAPAMVSPRALPVDPSALAADTHSAPSPDAPMQAVRALPVDPSELTNAAPVNPSDASAQTSSPPATNSPVAENPDDNARTPPRALPVSPDELAGNSPGAPPTPPAATVALNTPPAASTPTPSPATTTNGTDGTSTPTAAPPPPAVATPAPSPPVPVRQSNGSPVMEPSLPPVEPSTEPAAPTAVPSTNAAAPAAPDLDKRLVLTASQDSFVRVTDLDAAPTDKPLYAAVLHTGQSVGFDGRKFSINVGVPSAVDIRLDGVNYGPHSDRAEPETFNVESHLP